MALFEERDWLKSKPPCLDLTDAYQKIKEKRKVKKGSKPRGRGFKKPPPAKVESTEATKRDPELRKNAIAALTSLGIKSKVAGEPGDTVKEVITDALRQRELHRGIPTEDGKLKDPETSQEEPKEPPTKYPMVVPATHFEMDQFVVLRRFKKFLREMSKFVPVKRALPIVLQYVEKIKPPPSDDPGHKEKADNTARTIKRDPAIAELPAPAKAEATCTFPYRNEIGTTFSKDVKLQLTDAEFKMFNRGLNPATPDSEVAFCAAEFFQSYRRRYHEICQM